MSFGSDIKDEITNIQIKNVCCKQAYILGMIFVNGMKETYCEIFDSNIDNDETSIKEKINAKECCARAFLRGAFLEGGYVNDPENSYHLEIIQYSISNAEFTIEIFKKYGLNFKLLIKKDKIYIYIKDAESIATVMNIIGAHKALLNFENVRAMHDMKNNINRVVNCETANFSKTVDASVRHIKMINEISESVGLNKLPKGLRNVAELRVNNPDLSLKELGELMKPKLGKSGVNHRLKKIEEFYKNLFK